jgi:hypothetical protein
MPQAAGRPWSRIRLSTARLLDFLTLSFVFIDIPGLFLTKLSAFSYQPSAFRCRPSDFLASRLLDFSTFLTLSFVFIDIPGSFRQF